MRFESRMVRAHAYSLLALVMVCSWSIAGFAPVAAMSSSGNDTTNAATQKQQLALLQSRATNEVNRRAQALNALPSAVKSIANLSEDQKAALNTLVSKENAELQNLKAAVNADTSLPAAQADVQRIDDEYAAYSLVIAKIRLLAAADFQVTFETKLSTVANKLQDRLNNANNQGKDIAQQQVLLNDMQAHTHTAQGLSNDVVTAVLPIKTGDYAANYSVLLTFYHKLAVAHDNQLTAVQDMVKLVTAVLNL